MRWSQSAALGVALAIAPAAAIEVVLSPPGTNQWHTLEFPKIKRHTAYTVVQTEGMTAIKAESDCAASALYVGAENVDLQQTPRLHWRWKIDRPLRVADERVKAGDDFAARVYVMFRFDPEHASFWERLRHSVATKLYGDVVPGSAIDYVWSSRLAAGTAWDNPFSATAKMVSLGRWAAAAVDRRNR